MSRVERVGNLDSQIEHRLDLQRLAADYVPERLAFQQFHGNKGSPIDLVDLMDRADVRVIKRGCCLGFPLKAAEGLRIVREFVRKKLQSDVTTELEVFRLIHHTHSTTTDLAENAVMGNCLPHRLGRNGHWRECYGEVREGSMTVPSAPVDSWRNIAITPTTGCERNRLP